MNDYTHCESAHSVQDLQPLLSQSLEPPARAPVRIHPRVYSALQSLPERLARANDVSLKTLASIAGLSPSRFMHVFTASVGTPLRPYILALRVRLACQELRAGATVTSAACAAGFSDAAHLTRTFRRILGTTPTGLFPGGHSPAPTRRKIRQQVVDIRHSSDEFIFAMSRKDEPRNQNGTNAENNAQRPRVRHREESAGYKQRDGEGTDPQGPNEIRRNPDVIKG
jgi:AraC-like DNA-binding protein